MSGKELARRAAAPSATKRSGAGVAKKAAPKKAAAKKAAAKKGATKAIPAKKAAKKAVKKVPGKKAAKKTPSAKRAAGPPRRSPRQRKSGAAKPALGLPQLPSPPTDPLAVLGLPEPFTTTDLRRAWRVYAARHHPDQGGDAATFARGRMAYDELRSRPR